MNEAREEANIANHAKGDFLANMSHEIRTPINGILGMDTMILRESKDPVILDYAASIRTAGQGLLSIVNDILDISKIESGRMELNETEFDLFMLINSCYQLVNMRMTEKGLSFNVFVNPKLPSKLIGDEIRIRQIINNLLSNALKYTKKGSVDFLVDYSPSEEENHIIMTITVKDTGNGIREDDKEQLFKAFKRLESTKNRSIEGTGLGLVISKQLLELMEGTIRCESEYGVGSSFIVTIPLEIKNEECIGDFETRLHAKMEINNIEEEVFFSGDKRVLAVDDVGMNLKVFAGFLKGTGIKVDRASSGLHAIEMTGKFKYDLIFMDHLMPEMDGIETFKRIREENKELNGDTPVIILTANALVGAKEKYIKEGFDDYLSKPIEREELIGMLRKYFD